MSETRPSPLTAPLAEIGAGLWALGRGAAGLPAAFSTREPFSERRLARALADYVWRPLLTVLALSGLLGVIAGLLCSSLLKKFHAELAVIPQVAELLVGQVSPLIVGVFAAGRVSVALTARLGGMQLQGEVDALTLQGREPARFVLGPVAAALLVAAPVLSALAAFAALCGVAVMLEKDAVTPLSRFVPLVSTREVAERALAGVGRGYVYVLLALAAGGAGGGAVMRDLGDLERRTTSAFTASLLLIFAAATVLAIWR